MRIAINNRVFRSTSFSADIDAFLASEERALSRLPRCAMCDEHIQQEMAVRLDGCWYCDECLSLLRESTEQ